MRDFQKLWICVAIWLLLLTAGANFYVCHIKDRDGDFYKIEIKRMAEEIEKNGIEQVDRDKYPSIVRVEALSEKELAQGGDEEFLTDSSYACQIRKIKDCYYRFDVATDKKKSGGKVWVTLNVALAVTGIGMIFLLWQVQRRIIFPFEKLQEVPYELAKGNLTMPLTVEKNKYFGNFTWGLNLLREHLEEQKELCLSLEKKKSTLLLSLSHDIKTPLSAIKLYAKALARNLYDSREKQKEVAESINEKADEIEAFLNEIMENTRDEFMDFEVKEEEFYLSEVIHKLENYYQDKLSYQHITFFIDSYGDCMLKGDRERFLEVLKNIMENAIKYGDGRKISIDFSREEDCQLIGITNSGNSLKDDEFAHIFDSFWRGSNAGGIEGSGLGLSICRKLMKNMKGDVFATGGGDSMTITVVLPRV